VVHEGLLQRVQHRHRPSARPSMVVMLQPLRITASVRQALMRVPSTSTVQAPHWPWSQPFLVPVNSSRSRSRSSSVTQGSTVPVLVKATHRAPAARRAPRAPARLRGSTPVRPEEECLNRLLAWQESFSGGVDWKARL
jgi:hypothetical protein